jgi:beta-glucosidase
MALASSLLSLYIPLSTYIFADFACADPDSLYQHQDRGLLTSPPDYPSPWADPEANGWEQAYAQARDFVSQLTLLEKVNLTTGVG